MSEYRFDEFGINAGFVEDLHAQYRQSPQSVDEQWRQFFKDLEGERAVVAEPEYRESGNGAKQNGNGNANGNGALA